MKFADILNNGKLWAVVYDGDSTDILTKTLSDWLNPAFLFQFFSANMDDLAKYFNITNLDLAIYDTVTDAASLSCLILDISPKADLDTLFRPLENYRIKEMLLSREKAKGRRQSNHPSWLRIYAIKLDNGIYLVTGGAIKLTHLMSERQHTIDQLSIMEKVRNYLIDSGIYDCDGLKNYMASI
ncbi:MAG: hypothetical protein J5632_00680 [Bacteroidales bacterium]|nr:hypothetical protein [Bacteroidales bacterium]